jgi:hypothetical protein
MRPSLQRNNRIPAVREEDRPRAPQACELGAEGRDRGHTRVDAKMLYAGAMGERDGAGQDTVVDVALVGCKGTWATIWG